MRPRRRLMRRRTSELTSNQHLNRAALQRFRAKWIPVRGKKTRQNKKLESGLMESERDSSLVLIKCGFFWQSECTEAKFLCRICVCVCVCVCRCQRRRFDQRKCGARELLPDSKIIRCDREPPEPEYVTSGLGYMSDLLPCDFIDHQSFCPSEHRGRLRSAGQVSRAC
jgi:hypothetical protein